MTERRSTLSVAARALVVAKADRETIEQELERTPGWRFRRRAAVEEALEAAVARERDLVDALGGKTPQRPA